MDRPYFQNHKSSGYMSVEHGLEWLQTDPEQFKIEVLAEPSHENGEQLPELQAIIEFYSR